MRKTTLSLAFTFAGCFLGAGYVSGQELWQFFGAHGLSGLLSTILAFIILFLLSLLIFFFTYLENSEGREQDSSTFKATKLNLILGNLQYLFMFGTVMIMSAGVGSVLNQNFGWPHFVGGGILCCIVAIFAYYGVKSMFKFFRLFIPILVLITLIVAFVAITFVKSPSIPNGPRSLNQKNPLLPNFVISTLLYIGNAMFWGIIALVPIAKTREVEQLNNRSRTLGIGGGSFFLLFIALSILLPLHLYPVYATYELPMIMVGSAIHPFVGLIFSFTIAFAMFGSALTGMTTISYKLSLTFPAYTKNKIVWIIFLSLVAWLGGLIGFGNLIGYLYPIGGYCGLFMVVRMFWRYYRVRNLCK